MRPASDLNTGAPWNCPEAQVAVPRAGLRAIKKQRRRPEAEGAGKMPALPAALPVQPDPGTAGVSPAATGYILRPRHSSCRIVMPARAPAPGSATGAAPELR
ncbi:MAG: hypothetical protein HYV07_33330 [Deltaproteobacteria bacterium]|nr:hypothetical protein [Deltaproteobacteria bacterium]